MTILEWVSLIIAIIILGPLVLGCIGYVIAKMVSEGWHRGKLQAEKLETLTKGKQSGERKKE